jgi:superfamily II DNA or RNA helicase
MDLNELTPKQRLIGLVGDKPVSVVAITRLTDDLVDLTYRTDDGDLGEQLLNAEEAASLTVLNNENTILAFDGDADEWRLVAEALRIKNAALYDPYIAVNSSIVEPLPHQIRAVYEELLPRFPLRFLLADDPGSGKTIMAGLYLKELILHASCERALIVVPGGLADQWQTELHDKFGLDFEVLTSVMAESILTNNVFMQHDLLIARMDHLARNEDLQGQLSDVNWDVVVIDEAHRMSAHFNSWGGDIKRTKRFQLGQLLSETAQNLLLMTATPHAGNEEDFQLFMSLLDKDRFEGRYNPEIHKPDTKGIMRRMIKEELLTFDGKPLFPERHAYTVSYALSPAEQELYEAVTNYVRTEMGRAELISESGDRKRGNNIGFALTVLQRRLASSPEAILRTLERRRDRLTDRLTELKIRAEASRFNEPIRSFTLSDDDLPELSFEEIDYQEDDLSDEDRASLESMIELVTDQATASLTSDELQTEIEILDQLIIMARRVRSLETDRKWVELSKVLSEQIITGSIDNNPHKIIIFTEHLDTLHYLQQKIGSVFLGREEAIVTIHGGVNRDNRRKVQEQFTNNPETIVLLATDAAGEGLNLQRAHLMVNYDLPWNPNRIEQRFGRIHRIGQKSVCLLWNLLAENTREGDVYLRLLKKLEQMGKAYDGKVFNVLGEKQAFAGQSLKDLLVEAIRYGESAEVRARQFETIDATIANGIQELLEERALNKDIQTIDDLIDTRNRMEQNRERRLQPGYIQSFFTAAFQRLGGSIHKRENGYYQINRVPKRIIEEAKRLNRWIPLADAYERITFEPELITIAEQNHPTLIAPGHPLLRAVIGLTINDLDSVLRQGTVFIDDTDRQEDEATMLYALEQRIDNPALGYLVSKHFDYVELSQKGDAKVILAPPYLDYRRVQPDEKPAAQRVVPQTWFSENHEQQVVAWAYQDSLSQSLQKLKAAIHVDTERTRAQVSDRLTYQINYWYREQSRLQQQENAGKTSRITAKQALTNAQNLEDRLAKRMHELDLSTQLVVRPGVIKGAAVVIPAKLLLGTDSEPPTSFALDTKATERRAVELALAAERALGRQPEEQARNNPGYDIRSTNANGEVFYIEVKGRIAGAPEFTVTANEVTYAKTQKDRHRLVLASIDPDNPANDEIRYLVDAFNGFSVSTSTQSYNEKWNEYWARGTSPR